MRKMVKATKHIPVRCGFVRSSEFGHEDKINIIKHQKRLKYAALFISKFSKTESERRVPLNFFFLYQFLVCHFSSRRESWTALTIPHRTPVVINNHTFHCSS